MDEQAVFRHFVKGIIQYGVSLGSWGKEESARLTVAGIVLLVVMVLAFLTCNLIRIILGRSKKNGIVRDFLVSLKWPYIVILIVCGLDCARYIVHFPPKLEHLLAKTFETAFVLTAVWGICNLVSVIMERYLWKSSSHNNQNEDLFVNLIRRFIKSIVVIICILFIGQNVFNFNISAMLAGAGVAGLAFAFAAQNTIANIFGAVTIAIDKPFVLGDRIVVGGRDGIVENLGLRSTKIRSMDGTVYVIPNKEMGDSPIENLTRRPCFKQVFSIGLVYETTPEQMERAKAILHEILDNHFDFDMEKLPPRIYFSEMKEWSLNISVTVWFQTTNVFAMMDMKDQVLSAILKRFNAEGLSFAYPTSTAYIGGPVQIKGDAKA